MKKNCDSAPSLVSDWIRELWAVEARHPPFAGSLKNMKFYIELDKPKAKRPKARRPKAAARKKATRVAARA